MADMGGLFKHAKKLAYSSVKSAADLAEQAASTTAWVENKALGAAEYSQQPHQNQNWRQQQQQLSQYSVDLFENAGVTSMEASKGGSRWAPTARIYSHRGKLGGFRSGVPLDARFETFPVQRSLDT